MHPVHPPKSVPVAGQGIDVWVGKLLSACMGISVTD